MKKAKISLLAVALIALCSAFATKEKAHTLANKRFILVQVSGTKFYVQTEITGEQKGLDYICENSGTCTVDVIETATLHNDANGNYFDSSDSGSPVVSSDQTGTYRAL